MLVKLPWKSDSDSAAETPETAENDAAESPETAAASDESAAGLKTSKGPATTPGKGRPTPKRRDAQGNRRVPAGPPPATRAEARARKKALKSSMSKDERKAARQEVRAKRREQQAAMMNGDERYMRATDRGPERRLIRDIVDSRRSAGGLFMPMAMVVVFSMFLGPIQNLIFLVMMAFIVIIALEGYFVGKFIICPRVRARYPDTQLGGWTMGWYGFRRGVTLRSMRAPKPQVKYGEKV